MHRNRDHRLDQPEVALVSGAFRQRCAPDRRTTTMTILDHDLQTGIESLLAEILARPGSGTGCQLHVSLRGATVVDLAVGATIGGEPLRTDHLHSGFCITKPLLGLAVGHLIDGGRLAPTAPVNDVIGAHPWIPSGVTVAEVLSHDAGLLRPLGYEWRLCPPDQRDDFLNTITNEVSSVYSEIGAGLVIEALVVASTGRSPSEFIEEEILRPLGVLDEVIVDSSLAVSQTVRSRVRVPIGGLPDRCIPLLSERVGNQLAETRPAFGSLVTMRGVGIVAAAIERVLAGHDHAGVPSPATLASMMGHRRSVRRDDLLHRDCEFAAMMQVGLGRHHVSNSATTRAVGHVAGIANCVTVSDPGSGMALAAYLNGSTLGDPHRAAATRLDLVDGIIDLVTGATS